MDTLCPTCGAEIPLGHRFCGRCGADASAPPVERSCWQCGTSVPATTTWCPTCGASATVAAGQSDDRPAFTSAFDAPPPPGLPAPPPGFEPPPGRGVTSSVETGPRERLLTPTMLTVLVAVAIVIALAFVGIVAGQAAGS